MSKVSSDQVSLTSWFNRVAKKFKDSDTIDDKLNFALTVTYDEWWNSLDLHKLFECVNVE
jgi:hypothetical protein